jgi:hypothetical protein
MGRRMSSPLVAPPVVKPKSLFCPNCGGPVERRGFDYTLNIVCPQCKTVLDATTPLFEVLQKAEAAQTREPLIPLGTRGKMSGGEWETIGFQVREIEVDGDRFAWEEYLLFNPYRGFRYLTHYNGHWNWVTPLNSFPKAADTRASYGGHVYKHFASARASTAFVLGEFPWQVRVGETVRAADYIAPPNVLSAESTEDETTWSHGVYAPASEIWKAFALPGKPPRPQGVYLNQPSPYGAAIVPMWVLAGWMCLALFGLMFFFGFASKNEKVLEIQRTFSSSASGEPSYVTRTFELTGRPTTVEVTTNTSLNNSWAFFNFALINDDTGTAYDFGREVSFYSGTDSDGSWTEGSNNDKVLVPAVPPGRYYLRVEPEADSSAQGGRYQITLRHDVPSYTWFFIAGALLLVPPVIRTIRSFNFERQRWAESDHAPVINLSDEDD